jgi:indole-3-glycerol phosphate synthase
LVILFLLDQKEINKMKQSKLTEETKAILLHDDNQEKLAELAKEFGIKAVSMIKNIKQDSRLLTQPCYLTAIKKHFKMPNKMVLTEDFIVDDYFLSKHN